MAVYYKFKSAKDYDSVRMDDHYISVLNLKEKIFESKRLGGGTDFDLVVTNAQTNEEYNDEATLIPKGTSVLIRRVPGRPRIRIIAQPSMVKEEVKIEEVESEKGSIPTTEVESENYTEEQEWDEFSNELYAIDEAAPVISNHVVPVDAPPPSEAAPVISNHVMPVDAPPPNEADEEDKIKALIDTPALGWQRFGQGRGGRGPGGKMMGGRGFTRGGFETKTPPEGYVCHRCQTKGHFIQHCPTNGNPAYNIRRVKPPTGIPKSMLIATPDGSYALPSGAVAVLRPNESAFEREIDGLPSTRSIVDLPPELRCPLCKEVMKDAVLTSKCCFKSYCDKCVREHIIAKTMCVCGATNVRADDLLPNKTLRVAISRMLEPCNTSNSAENAGSAHQVQDMESALCPPPKSASSKGEGSQGPRQEEASAASFKDGGKADVGPLHNVDSAVKAQEKAAASEPVKKKKKKKSRLPGNDLQWRGQDFGMENFMMPVGPSFNPYWAGFQPGMESYGVPYPYSNYGYGPMDNMSFGSGGMMSQDPYAAQQSYSFPSFHQMSWDRQEAKIKLGSRGEGEKRGNDNRGKIIREARDSREFRRDSKEANARGSNVNSLKSNYKSMRHIDRTCQHGTERSPSSLQPVEPLQLLKREADRFPENRKRDREMDRHRHHFRSDGEAERNNKASVFSRISFPSEEEACRRKASSGEAVAVVTRRKSSSSNGFHESNGKARAEHKSSDKDRDIKRKTSSHGPAPSSKRVHGDGGSSALKSNCDRTTNFTSCRKLAAKVF